MDHDFSPLERDVWGGLVVTQGTLRRRLDAVLQERHQLSHGEFEVLLLLSWTPDRRLRLSDLATRSMLTLSGMSRLIDRLERSGLVRRASCSEDRRGAYAELTEAGAARLQAAKASEAAVVRRHFLSLYDEQELRTLAGLWQRFLERERPAPVENSRPAGPEPALEGTQ